MADLDKNTVLLFYREYERDKFIRHDRYLKRVVRPIYDLIRRDQSVSGFLMWYRLLVLALRRSGYRVVLNDRTLARRHPEHPVGLIGYPNVLDGWDLPNPAVLGPGLFDHPALAPHLLDDPRYRLYITTCTWIDAVFRRFYGDCCVQWHAGIDVAAWPDTLKETKTVDFLIYDKIRWDRQFYDHHLLHPILAELSARRLSYHVLRYGHYKHENYRNQLRHSRAMLFLCEHETQGMAYQEAMACNVPILAWDNGYWLDPRRTKYTDHPVRASSVPYFSSECGERFVDYHAFSTQLDLFLERLPSYRPRAYVERELSLGQSGQLYMSYYSSLFPASYRNRSN